MTVIEHYRGIINALGGVVPDENDKLLTTYLQAIQEAIEAGGGGGGTPQVQSDWTETDTTKKSFIKNKPTLLTRVRLTADDTHIYKDGTALTYAEVEALVMNPNKFVTLVYNGEVSFLPSATDGSAIWFDGAFIVSDVVNHMRVIIDSTDAVKVTQLELARLDEVLRNTHKIVELGMLGWNVPDDCPIQNQISGKQFIQKVGRVDIGTFYWMYRASDGFMTTNYQVPSKTIAETDKPNAYCEIYRALPRSGAVSINNVDKSFAVPNKYIVIHDSAYTDARTFMDAVKGVYVYYELETPITKKIDGNEALITKEILESQKLNKISMEGEFNIWTDGNDAKIEYEDNYITMEGDYITIHNNTGNASKITMNDGDIKLEGCPDAGITPNAMIQLGTNDGNTSFIDMQSNILKHNGKDIATIDALQPVYINNLMSYDIDPYSVTDDDLKKLSRQITHILKNYNFMVLRMYMDAGSNTVVRNVATSGSSGTGDIVLPIINEGNTRAVDAYMLLGDEVHEVRLRFSYMSSNDVFQFMALPSYTASGATSWAYNKTYDSIINKDFSFGTVTLQKLGGLVPFTSNKIITVN